MPKIVEKILNSFLIESLHNSKFSSTTCNGLLDFELKFSLKGHWCRTLIFWNFFYVKLPIIFLIKTSGWPGFKTLSDFHSFPSRYSVFLLFHPKIRLFSSLLLEHGQLLPEMEFLRFSCTPCRNCSKPQTE